MKFIKSKVYPDLYLVKNPVKNRDSIDVAIRQMVLKKVTSDFNTAANKDRFLRKGLEEIPYQIRFYEYYTGTPFFVPFGEAGTTHFIEHKEDPGGFSSEEISHYNRYRIAEFNLKFCRNDSLHYEGILNYYKGWERIKKETLIDLCQQISEEAPSETIVDAN